MTVARGFTLLEILVVLFILGVAMAAALPSLGRGAQVAENKAAVREVMAGLKRARIEAISTRREATLTMDLAKRKFRLSGEAAEHSLPMRLGVKLFTAQQEVVNAEVGSVRFYPDGSSTGGRITLEDGPVKYDIDIDWLTGRIRLLDPAKAS